MKISVSMGVALMALTLVRCAGGNDPAPGSGGQAGSTGTSAGGSSAGAAGIDAGLAGAGGSGQAGSAPGIELVMNEIFPSGDPTNATDTTDWVELKNLSDVPLALEGYVLAQNYDGQSMPAEGDQIPLSGSIAAGAYFIATTSNATTAMGTFGISTKKTERLTLFDPSGEAIDDTTTDGTDTDPFADGVSWARYPDGTGAFARRAETREAPNME